MKTRLIVKHKENCLESVQNRSQDWYTKGEIERHNKAGWGFGWTDWLVLRCRYRESCPAKLLVLLSDVIESATGQKL